MWINKTSATFILIQYKGKGKFKFTFPISLYSFFELFEDINDIFTIAKTLLPTYDKKNANKFTNDAHVAVLRNMAEVALQLIKEFKKAKGCTIVEVQLDEIYVKVAIV